MWTTGGKPAITRETRTLLVCSHSQSLTVMRQSVATLPLRSRITTDGIDRAPHRAFMRGMGLDDAAIARPFIGVVTTAGDTTPCNGTLAEQATHAQEGVQSAGGTPRAFTTISVSDRKSTRLNSSHS